MQESTALLGTRQDDRCNKVACPSRTRVRVRHCASRPGCCRRGVIHRPPAETKSLRSVTPAGRGSDVTVRVRGAGFMGDGRGAVAAT